MGFYSAKTDLAFRQQKEAERKRRMASDPGRRLLNASVDQLPKLLGRLAVDAAQYGLFGGKEELASKQQERVSLQKDRLSQQKYRLWEMGKESPSQRRLFERLYGERYVPTKPPEGFNDWLESGRQMSATTPLSPVGAGGRDLMVPKAEYAKAKAAGVVTDDMGLGDLIAKAESARKKMGKDPVSFPEPESLMKDGQEMVRVTKPEYDAIRPTEKAPTEEAPKRKPLSVMEQADQEVAKMYPDIFGTQYKSDIDKRSTLIKERAKVIETEDRKELEAFKKEVDSRFELYNKTAKKLTGSAAQEYKNQLTKDLVASSGRLKDRNLEKGLMYVSSGYNSALPEEAANFERAVLTSTHGGRVEDITVFGARPGPRTYVKIPSPRSIEGSVKTNSLSIMRNEKTVKRINTDIARLKKKADSADSTPAQKKTVNAAIEKLEREKQDTLADMREASEQIKAAMNREDIKIDPPVKTQEVEGLGTVTLFRFEGKEASDLDPSRLRKRAADDWKNVVSEDGGDKKARSMLVDKVKGSYGPDSPAYAAVDPDKLRALKGWKETTNEEKIDIMANRLAEAGVTPSDLKEGRSRAVVQEEKKAVAANVVADPQLLKGAPISEDAKNQAIAGEMPGGVVDTLFNYGVKKGVSAAAPITSFKEAKARHDWLTRDQWKEISANKKKSDFFMSVQKGLITSYDRFNQLFKQRRSTGDL
jgi:hypothetical protein